MANPPLVSTITSDDDLNSLCERINGAAWDDANDLSDYDAESLAWYLAQSDTLFLACHEADTGRLMGIASGRILYRPYEKSRWLYVDEVDVAVDMRQRGAGRAMMQRLIEIARANDCEEVWLGTEPDNAPANALYTSLAPEERETFIGYTWTL